MRDFFEHHHIHEVFTPILAPTTTPSLHTHSLELRVGQTLYYLQTSPEFGMKKLLLSGMKDCYQISAVFRANEKGAHHLTEFSMCEYYRLGFDSNQLMDELEEFLKKVEFNQMFKRITYDKLFEKYLQIKPTNANLTDWEMLGKQHQLSIQLDSADQYQAYFLSHYIEPKLAFDHPFLWVTHFPKSQQEFAALDPKNPKCALRFELYIHGIEIANGYQELQTHQAYQQQFSAMQLARKAHQQNSVQIDQDFLNLLKKNDLPPCSGASIGIERLLSVLK